MALASDTTYLALLRPIPPKSNLANVATGALGVLCEFCKAVVPDRSKGTNAIIRTLYERTDVYPHFSGLKRTAKEGCTLCHLFRHAIRAGWGHRAMEEWGYGPLKVDDDTWSQPGLFSKLWDGEVIIRRVNFDLAPIHVPGMEQGSSAEPRPPDTTKNMVVGLSFEFGPANAAFDEEGEPLHGEIGQVLSFKVFDSSDLAPEDHSHRRQLPSQETLSPRNIDMIHGWIDECNERHPYCEAGQEPWVPSRLLYVGSVDGLDDPRLVEKGEIDHTSQYAALSHMWGEMTLNPPTRTLQSNLQLMKNGIDIRDISKNFRDAIKVCRALSIRYIWIDSLCIIQDSDEDWRREASTMHLVYRHAVITVVATSATSAHAGFLDRDIAAIPAIKTSYELNGKQHTMIVASRGPDNSGVRAPDIDASAWNGRGWTMQERSLSTRSIHFCRNKIYFECRSALKSEENEPEILTGFPFSMWPRNSFQFPLKDNDNEGKAKALFLYSKWCTSMAQYTFRKFTFASDKLIAIRSIATEMFTAIGAVDDDDNYIPAAGMWKGNLQKELLWYRGSGRSVRSQEYRAPTWSWASMDCRVAFTGSAVKGQLKISPSADPPAVKAVETDVRDYFKVVAVGEKENPIVRQNFLRVQGFAKRLASLSRVDDHDHWTAVDRSMFPWDATIDGVEGEGDGLFAQCLLDEESAGDYAVSSMETRTLFYLHITNDRSPSGLILRDFTAGENIDDIWTRRIGVATIFGKDGKMLSGYEFTAMDYLTLYIT